MGAVDLSGRVVMPARGAMNGVHDFLGGDFLILLDSGAEDFFVSPLESLDSLLVEEE